MSKKYDGKKLEAIGLLKAGYNMKEVSRTLSIPYTVVTKWKPEADALEDKKDLEDVLDADKAIVHELAEGIRGKLEDIAPESGELIDATLERIDQLQELQVDLQGSGVKLLKKINKLVDDCERADDILKFVEAVAKLQTAFFSKGANVNVLNMPGGNSGEVASDGMSMFKSLQRKA